MLGAKNADGKVNDGNVHECKNSEYGCKRSAARGLFHEVAQQQVGDVKEPQDERRGQPRVPCPPDSPNGLGPNGPCNQSRGAKERPDLRASQAQAVPLEILCDQVPNTADEDQEVGEEGSKKGREMHIEDAL